MRSSALPIGLLILLAIVLVARQPVNRFIDAKRDERKAELVDANMKRLAEATNNAAAATNNMAEAIKDFRIIKRPRSNHDDKNPSNRRLVPGDRR